MTYREIEERDIAPLVEFFTAYFNTQEGDEWTVEKAYRRLRPVCLREDSLNLLAEENGRLAGFAIGGFTQYDDLLTYDLFEILLGAEYQNRGEGTRFMEEVFARAKERGAAMVQLIAVNDEMHEHFYGKLGFYNATNLVLKAKML